jgi:hypothetical protein
VIEYGIYYAALKAASHGSSALIHENLLPSEYMEIIKLVIRKKVIN